MDSHKQAGQIDNDATKVGDDIRQIDTLTPPERPDMPDEKNIKLSKKVLEMAAEAHSLVTNTRSDLLREMGEKSRRKHHKTQIID